MTQPTISSHFNIEGPSEAHHAVYMDAVEREGLTVTAQSIWVCDEIDVDAALGRFDSVWTVLWHTGFATVAKFDEGIADVSIMGNGQRVTVVAASKTAKDARAIVARVKGWFPELKAEPAAGEVSVRFWYSAATGASSVRRRIAAPPLDDIRLNYSDAVMDHLSYMASDDFMPGKGGQLILWYGPPGVGKTYALRALASEWREWCDVDYVVDPERFFGDSGYLMPVLLSHESVQSDDPKAGWRLLIFEDTGELLSADARVRAGQGLSRLLNVVDGFVGQGLRTLILITTNEDLGTLHPAVARPGRCAVKVPFTPLSSSESARWAERNGVIVPRKEHTLAELFAARDQFHHTDSAKRPVGFGFAA